MLQCPQARAIWFASPLGLQPIQQGDIGLQDWVAQMASNLSRESFDLVLMLMWNIWRARNELFWKGTVLPPQEIQIQAQSWLMEFKKWYVVQPKPKVVEGQKWRKPD